MKKNPPPWWVILSTLAVSFYHGVKSLKDRGFGFWFFILGLVNLLLSMVKIKWLTNSIFFFAPGLSGNFLFKWTNSFSILSDFILQFFVVSFSALIVSGFIKIKAIRKYQKSLHLIIPGKEDNPTRVLSVEKPNKTKVKLTIKCPSVGFKRIENAKDDLEAACAMNIESISRGQNPGIVEIVLNSIRLKRMYFYSDLKGDSPLKDSFIVGQSTTGVIEQKIQELPHLLIAGTTGGGKSIFLKQVLLRLLETSSHLQMYLVDLKGGVELGGFTRLSNCELARDVNDAIHLLTAIKEEMKERFEWLRKKKKKEIDPKKDGKDRIVVAIDEASILYTTPSRGFQNYKKILEARFLTDEIAKLGRAAAIHLILATQKVTHKTIETSIQENITGKMCFRMNTLQGSVVVIGTKEANVLPSIAGRGIWQMGQKSVEVQTPWVSQGELDESLDVVERVLSKQKKSSDLIWKDEKEDKGGLSGDIEETLMEKTS